jgi:hypothetical protein
MILCGADTFKKTSLSPVLAVNKRTYNMTTFISETLVLRTSIHNYILILYLTRIQTSLFY